MEERVTAERADRQSDQKLKQVVETKRVDERNDDYAHDTDNTDDDGRDERVEPF